MNLYQQMNRPQNQNPSNLKQQYQQFCKLAKSSNPNELIQNMMLNNPQIKGAMNFIQSVGGDPQTAFYNLAKQKGVDPESILSQLR